MQIETIIYEQTETFDDLVEGKITHDVEDEAPYYIELHQGWMSEKSINILIKTLRGAKRIRKTGSVQ